ncbi:class A beta-lactamase-related serine hydrolase [Prolixibacteraceae bacterium JC049]|nr:class A beta-lactamase-related serine hydrolase [Prolixibacteraceae bacterium JC049]
MKNLFIPLLILSFLFINVTDAECTIPPNRNISKWIDSEIAKGMDSLNIAGATIVVVRGDSIMHMKGYGVADIEKQTPVDAKSSIFGIGSISKTFVATAAMQLVEKGKLELDRDINNYLTNFQIRYHFNDSITIRNLLTHSAGFDLKVIGTCVRNEEDYIPLSQYLKKEMPKQIRPAGKAIAYSNQGYALLGLIVEKVSGIPFYEYVEKNILEPLKMESSGFKRKVELQNNYATSYFQDGTQLVPYKQGWELCYPASSMSSTASDMAHYISMFLNNGLYNQNKILTQTSIEIMTQKNFKQYNNAEFGWLLGFQENSFNGKKIYGHGGAVQGFASQLFIFPEKQTGVFISLNCSHYLNSKSYIFNEMFVKEIFKQLFPQEGRVGSIKKTFSRGNVDAPIETFAGTYRYNYYAHSTFDKVGILIGLAPEINICARDSFLHVQEWNLKITPDSALTFLNKKYGHYFAFGRNQENEIAYFYAQNHGYDKLKWFETLKFHMLWVGITVLLLLIYLITSGVQKIASYKRKNYLLKKVTITMASALLLFLVLFAYGMKTTDVMQFFYGVPPIIKYSLFLPIIVIALELYSFYLLGRAIKTKTIKTQAIVWQAVVVLTVLLFIPWLAYYNLIVF